MILSKGKNSFPDNKFNFMEWSASILQTPEEVIQKVHELRLVERVVKDIIAVGMGYNWTDYGIDEAVYNAIDRMHPLLKEQIPNPDAFLPKGVEIQCFAEIDEPLMVLFEDGDTLCISYNEGSSVRMDLNSIPLSIQPGINQKTFHAGRLFDDMIGKRITAVEVTASTECPKFTGSYGLTIRETPSYITKVDILYDDGSICWPRRRLSFTSDMDYGWVELIDCTGRTIGVPTEKVPWIVEGFIPQEEMME